jgi:hypothetical protein
MANIAPSQQDYVNAFQQAQLTLATPVSNLNYIGQFYSMQMAAHPQPVTTIDDLIRATANLNLAAVRQRLAEYVKNQRANSCLQRGAKQYHVRDFSFVAFNSLVNVLKAARQLGLGAHGHAARLPTELVDLRDASTAECSCRQTRAACLAAGAASCNWKDLPPAQRAAVQNRPGVCQPAQRVRRQQPQAANGARSIGVAFPGIRANEPGQKRRRNQPAEPGQTFIGLWRVPD